MIIEQRYVSTQRKPTMVYSNKQYEKHKQRNSIIKMLLGIPVLYKVLIANSLIIFVGATGGTWLATHLNSSPYATTMSLVSFITLGWLVSVALNFVLLRIAFRPLTDLGKFLNCEQDGERISRAPCTGLDPQPDQLATPF